MRAPRWSTRRSNRLPEKYRAPIVLCYLEGLTHDEAAIQLKWPVGTVRSRLSRARDTLRSRLTRRGVTAPSTLGAMSAWILFDEAASSATASAALPGPLAASLARSATRFAISQPATTGSLSVVAMRLAQGVLTTMMLKKLTIAGCVILSLGIASIGGGAYLIRASRAQELGPARAAAPAPPEKRAFIAEAPDPGEIDPLLRELLEAARKRVEAQRAYYEEGRITLDRFIDSLAHLEKVQLIAARSDADRMAIRGRHVSLLAEIEKREKAEQELGRGTEADVSEARQRHLEAEYEMKYSEKEANEKAAILRRLSELERKVQEIPWERIGKHALNP